MIGRPTVIYPGGRGWRPAAIAGVAHDTPLSVTAVMLATNAQIALASDPQQTRELQSFQTQLLEQPPSQAAEVRRMLRDQPPADASYDDQLRALEHDPRGTQRLRSRSRTRER